MKSKLYKQKKQKKQKQKQKGSLQTEYLKTLCNHFGMGCTESYKQRWVGDPVLVIEINNTKISGARRISKKFPLFSIWITTSVLKKLAV